jgi:hypothetical protein
MKEEEKAWEIICAMLGSNTETIDIEDWMDIDFARQNVVKAKARWHVDEIIDLLGHDLGHDNTARMMEEYYQRVKLEIQKL